MAIETQFAGGIFGTLGLISTWIYAWGFLQCLIYLFFIAFVFTDAPKYNMDRWFWTLIHISIPIIGIIAYIVVRTIREREEGFPYKDHTGEELFSVITKRPLIRLVLFIIIIITFLTFVWMVGGTIIGEFKAPALNQYEDQPASMIIDENQEYGSNYIGIKRERSMLNGKDEGEIRFDKDGIGVVQLEVKEYGGEVTTGIYTFDGIKIVEYKGNVNEEYRFKVKKNKIYRVIVNGEEAKTRYEIRWNRIDEK